MAEGLRTSEGKPAAPPFTKGPYENDQAWLMQKPSVDSYNRYVLEENFEKLPQKNTTIDGTYTTEAARNCNLSFLIIGIQKIKCDCIFRLLVIFNY